MDSRPKFHFQAPLAAINFLGFGPLLPLLSVVVHLGPQPIFASLSGCSGLTQVKGEVLG